ncbi:MAG: hypothetical protein NTX50_00625 [Candidatus Sumerlaeota bacterium]|nr:hypothetical protein [Candidatus Sumerlaeota bacterium]
MSRKKPRQSVAPQDQKQPRSGMGPRPSPDTLKPVWRFSIMDFSGDFGWRHFDVNNLGWLDERLANFETMTWHEIKGEKNHSIKVHQLSPEAQKQLAKINQNDIDEVFSLRLGAKQRLIGILDQHRFKILWWDPEHRVCPSPPPNT